MPKQLNVNLAFTADTSQAKKSLNDLQISLQEIAKLPGKASSLFDDTDIKNANKAAMELQQHLNAAINVKTGNLDLSRFSTSLKSTKKDLNSYYNQLVKIGPQGQEAFLKLAKTISIAEAPVTRINSKLAEMGVTLKNAARWQISSSILHGFMGTLQGAYGYAQDLNESLNNIRIVTGQSVDEMAKFAEQANKSAKALSTTTTAYTDAALIFYQQGLSGDAVTERTDTVVKMANVTRQSAEEVSSYMTAIWNNFYNGSESLEHYADVITALGAATASSSAEIAEGLSKFASVAETIGLSYDYATSILAALVANTRQSADTVGTALKTILARLQSVKLGETLDDGTELTKYTQALQTIGVSIFDLNGNMKDADEILEDTAAKWDTLTKAQQAGVAQTVAGTRQYAQFIAIMENWGDVQKNLQTAQGAEGTLQNQADIYAESWEAASKRVKAAAQGIYQNLLDDKFFISLNDNLAKLLQTIDGVVKGFGGMKGVLTAVGSVFLSIYAQKMPTVLDNLKQNFMVFTGQATKEMLKVQRDAASKLAEIQNDPSSSLSYKTQAEGIAKVNEMQQKLIINSKNMTEAEQNAYKARIQNVQAMYDEATAIAKETEELMKNAEAAKQAALATAEAETNSLVNNYTKSVGKTETLKNKVDTQQGIVNNMSEDNDNYSAAIEKLNAYKAALVEAQKEEASLEAEVLELAKNFNISADAAKSAGDQVKDALKQQTDKYTELSTSMSKLKTISASGVGQSKAWKDQAKDLQNNDTKLKAMTASMQKFLATLKQTASNDKNLKDVVNVIKELEIEANKLNSSSAEDVKNFAAKMEQALDIDATGTQFKTTADIIQKEIDEITEKVTTIGPNTEAAFTALDKATGAVQENLGQLGDTLNNVRHQADENIESQFQLSIAITQFASAAMATYTAVNSLKNAFSTIKDVINGDATAFDVIGASISALMSIMMAYNAISQLTQTLKKKEIVTNGILAAGEMALVAAENGLISAKVADTIATLSLEAANVPLLITTLAVIAAMAALAITILSVVAAIGGVVAAIKFLKANSPEGKLKALKETASEAAEAARDTAQAYEDIKSALDNLDSGINTIEELERGTFEWKQAILESNNALIELLSTYKMLSSDNFITDADGLMKITDKARESILEQAASRSEQMNNANYAEQIRINNAENRVNASNAAANITVIRERTINGETQQYDAVTSNSDLSADIGMAIAEALDSGALINEDLVNGSERLVSLLEKNTDVTAIEAKSIAEQIAGNEELIQKMSELAIEVSANTEANRILNNQIIESNFSADIDKSDLSDKNKEYLKNMMGSDLEDLTEELYNSTWKDMRGKTDAEIQKKYAEAMGYDINTIENKSGNKAKYYRKDGTEVGVISDETARKYLAQQEAIEQMQENVQSYIDTMEQLIQTGNQIANGVGDALASFVGGNGGDLFNLTETEKKTFSDSISKYDKKTKTFKIGDTVIDQTAAEALGYKTVEEYYNALQAAIDSYDSTANDIGKDWLNKTNTVFKNLLEDKFVDELTLTEQKALGEALNTAVIRSGSTDVFDSLFEAIPTNKIDEFAQILSTIDWQNTSVKDLKEQLETAGIKTVGLDEKLQNLIDVMQIDGVKSVNKLTEAYKKTADIIKDLKDGDTISADDYAALDENSQKYFQLMMDGTYQLIGNAEELQRLLNGNGVESFRESIKSYQDQNEDYNRIKNYDFDTLSTTRADSAGEDKFNSSEVQQQLDLLKVLKGAEEEQIALWQQELDSGTMSVSSLDEIAIAVQGCGTEYNRLNELIASNNAQIEAQKEALAASCTSLAQLDGMLADTTISTEAYNKALDNVTRTEAEIHKLDYDDIIDQAKALAKAYRLDESAARQLAIQNQRLNRGLANLVNNLDDWKKGLKETDKTSMDYIDTVQEISAAIVDMVGASEDLKLDGTFMEDNLDLITKAAEGSEEAINNLGIEVARFQVEAMQNPIDPSTINGASSAQAYQEFENWKSTILSGIDELQTNLDDLNIGDNVFDKLGGDNWVEALNQMASITRMSVDEMNSLLNSMGVQAEISTVGKTQKIKVPQYHTQRENVETDNEGNIISYDELTYQIDSKEMDGYVEVAQINTGDAIGKKPEITYTGNSSPSTSAGNGGGNGKKGGGKTSERKKKDKIEKFEADPFHKVNQELEDVAHNLAIINKQQSHMFGKELINSLKQQNAELSKQVSLHKQKAQIAKDEANALRAQLEAQGVAFDGDNIANYNAMLQAAEAQINILIAQYNALSAAEQEAWDNAAKDGNDPIKEAEKRYENLKKMMDKYVNYMSIVYSEEEAALDALYQQIENNLKAYEIEIELKLDTTDAERALNKFLKTMQTDIKNLYKTSTEWADIFSTAVKDSQTYLKDNQTKRDQLAIYKQAYANKDWGKKDSIFVSESEALKKITDLQKELLEDSENILNLYQDTYNNLKDAFSEVADQFNDIINEFQRIDDTLDHYEKVIELLHGGSETEQGRKELDQLYKIRKENSLATQDSLRQYIQALEARKQAALANGFDADDSYIRDIEEEINNANDKLTSEIEDYIDTIQRELENSIKMAQAAMDKNVWGDTTTNVSQEWDDKKAQAEGYYDTVERIYQLESLESKWKTAITSTSSLKAQQQLTELMNKQVEALENKTILSEKDIELAEKELQVYQAQIALEDAQNNKNSMKLTRDEAGNWSYQYVADEGDVSNKQQDYLNKINEWRTASINATEEIAEKTMQAYETFSERMSEIMNDVTLSEEERDAKIQALNETYWGEEGIITRLVEDSNYIQGVANRATYEELASLYLADEDNVTRMTETEQELIATMIENGITSYSNLRDFVAGDDGKSGVYGEIKEACIETNKDSSAAWKSMAADAIGRMYKDPDSVKNTINLAYKEMTDALSNYDKAIIASEQASGREWSKVDKQLITTQGNIQGVWNKVDAVIQKSYELNIFEQNVLNIKNAWEQVAQATQEATKELLTYMSYLNNGSDSGGKGGGSGSSGKGGGSDSGSSGSSTGDTGTGAEGEQKGSTNTLDTDTAWGIAAAIWTEGDSAWFNGSTRQSRITEKFGDGAYEQIQSIINAHSANGDLYNYWKNNLGGNAKAYHYSSFDTGGYTGDWSGGDGRLAMLHSKELVLNQNDTENILSAVNAVREIASLGDSISNAIANGISNMIMSLAGLGKNNYNSHNNKIETNNGNNTFEITMNVDGGDVQEIQRAILDLPNLASQFLSKK